MAATVANVITQARNKLLDTSAVTGTLLSDNQYLGLVNEALSELLMQVRNYPMYRVIRERVTRVAQYTGYLEIDANDSLPGFGYVIDVWMQKQEEEHLLTSVTGTGLITLQWTTPATLVPGQPVCLYGMSDPHVGGEFPVLTVTSTTQVAVNVPLVLVLTTAGWISWGTQGWSQPLIQSPTVVMPQAVGDGSPWYAMLDGGMRFAPASYPRLMKVRYAMGGNFSPATTDVLDLQEAVPVLGQMLALKAGASMGAPQGRLDAIRVELYGDGTRRVPGSLALLKQGIALQRQNQQSVRPRWRPRRPAVYPTIVQA